MRRTTVLGFVGTLLASAGLAAVGPAEARPADRAVPNPVVSHRTGADTAQEQARVRAYWTRARMRAAVPKVVTGRPTGSGAVQAGPPAEYKGKPGGGGGGTTTDGYLGGPWTGGGQVVATTGKVFFTEGSLNYVCSGSAVTSADESTVVTAGHCVNEGPGAFVTNFAFVPGYDHGRAPYGTWVATVLRTTTQWQTSGDFDYDVGMAEMATLGGSTLTDTVGSQGIAFNQPRGRFVHSFGYPAARPYDGQVLDYCSGTAGDDTVGSTNDLRLVCNMTGGSSGGPWFQDFGTGTGVGTQVSLNSFGYRGEKNAMYGPYFGAVVETLYQQASAP